ncbi:Phage tail fiber protein [Weissella confusa]|nr:Phage tail fiber protein [Weissella confusa]
MYKDGKKWVFASMATLSLIGAFLAGGTAHADDQDVDHSQTVDTSEQGNAPNSESVVVLSATPASSDAASESVASSVSEASSNAQTSSADAKGETSASLSAQSEALQSSDARTGETRSVASETSATSSVATSSFASSASQASSVASSTASSTAVSSVASSAAGASYSADSAKSVAAVVTSIVAEMHSVAAADSAAIAASTTDNVVRNTAMEAVVTNVVNEANRVANNLKAANESNDEGDVEVANTLMLLSYNALNNMTFELQQAIQMVAADQRGVDEKTLRRAQTAYATLDGSLYNASFALSAYGDLIVTTQVQQYAKVVAALQATGLYDEFRTVVDPQAAVDTFGGQSIDAKPLWSTLAHNDEQIYNEFTLSGSASKPYKTATGGTSSVITQTTSTDFTARVDTPPAQVGDATQLADKKDADNDEVKFDLTGSLVGKEVDPTYAVAGAATYKYQLQANQDFSITGRFYMSKPSNKKATNPFWGGSSFPAGDFLGLFLTPSDPGTIGGTNGDMGIGGLANSISWGIDFFYNSDKGDAAMSNNTNQTYLKQDYPVVGFRSTDASGNLVNAVASDQTQYATNLSSGTKYDTKATPPTGINDASGTPYYLIYTAKTHTLTAYLMKPNKDSTPYDEKSASSYNSWSFVLPSNLWNSAFSLGLLGVTGGNGTVMQASVKVTQTNPVLKKAGTIIGQQSADDLANNHVNEPGDTHFAGSLKQATMTVKYIDKATGLPIDGMPETTGILANVGDTVAIDGVTDAKGLAKATNILGAPVTGATSEKNVYVFGGKTYKLVSADPLTVSGDPLAKNELNLFFQLQEDVSIVYKEYSYASGQWTLLDGKAIQGTKLVNFTKTGFNADTIDYSDVVTSLPGYATNYRVDGKYVSQPAKFDSTLKTIEIVFVPMPQTIATKVTGLPNLPQYDATKTALETSPKYETDSPYTIPTPIEVPGYDGPVVTDEAGNVITNFKDLATPAVNKTYTYTYTAKQDTKAKVYFTYLDMDTGLVKPIDKDAVGLERVNGHQVYTDSKGTYVEITGATDSLIDPAPYEAVSGGFTWDNKLPAATTFAADGSSSITLNFTENEVIATLYYYVDRGDGKPVRFAPLGVGTANTFIYKGYANTKMPTDPAKFAQLYPQVSGYTLEEKDTHVANQEDIITDVKLSNGKDLLQKGLPSTTTLSADSTANNVFVLYRAVKQTAVIRYVDQDGNLITNFVDADGNKITMPTTLTGVTGQDYGLGTIDNSTTL